MSKTYLNKDEFIDFLKSKSYVLEDINIFESVDSVLSKLNFSTYDIDTKDKFIMFILSNYIYNDETIETFIKNIKNINYYQTEKKEECPICLDCNEEQYLQFECGHIFHKSCINEWFDKKKDNYCPTCNQIIDIDINKLNPKDVFQISLYLLHNPNLLDLFMSKLPQSMINTKIKYNINSNNCESNLLIYCLIKGDWYYDNHESFIILLNKYKLNFWNNFLELFNTWYPYFNIDLLNNESIKKEICKPEILNELDKPDGKNNIENYFNGMFSHLLKLNSFYICDKIINISKCCAHTLKIYLKALCNNKFYNEFKFIINDLCNYFNDWSQNQKEIICDEQWWFDEILDNVVSNFEKGYQTIKITTLCTIIKRVEELITYKIIKEKIQQGYFLNYLAASKYSLRIFKMLEKYDISYNRVHEGYNLLLDCARYGSFDTFKYLVKKDNSSHILNISCETYDIVNCAAINCDDRILKFIVKHKNTIFNKLSFCNLSLDNAISILARHYLELTDNSTQLNSNKNKKISLFFKKLKIIHKILNIGNCIDTLVSNDVCFNNYVTSKVLELLKDTDNIILKTSENLNLQISTLLIDNNYNFKQYIKLILNKSHDEETKKVNLYTLFKECIYKKIDIDDQQIVYILNYIKLENCYCEGDLFDILTKIDLSIVKDWTIYYKLINRLINIKKEHLNIKYYQNERNYYLTSKLWESIIKECLINQNFNMIKALIYNGVNILHPNLFIKKIYSIYAEHYYEKYPVDKYVSIIKLFRYLKIFIKKKYNTSKRSHSLDTYIIHNEMNFFPNLKKNNLYKNIGKEFHKHMNSLFDQENTKHPIHINPKNINSFLETNNIITEKADGITKYDLKGINFYPPIKNVNTSKLTAEYIEKLNLYMIYDANDDDNIINLISKLRNNHPYIPNTEKINLLEINKLQNYAESESNNFKKYISDNKDSGKTLWWPKKIWLAKKGINLLNDLSILQNYNNNIFDIDGWILTNIDTKKSLKIKPKSHLTLDLLYDKNIWYLREEPINNVIYNQKLVNSGNIYRCYWNTQFETWEAKEVREEKKKANNAYIEKELRDYHLNSWSYQDLINVIESSNLRPYYQQDTQKYHSKNIGSNIIRLIDNKKVLDIGCGHKYEKMSKYCEDYLGIELDYDIITKNDNNLWIDFTKPWDFEIQSKILGNSIWKYYTQNYNKLNSKFDIFICNNTIHYAALDNKDWDNLIEEINKRSDTKSKIYIKFLDSDQLLKYNVLDKDIIHNLNYVKKINLKNSNALSNYFIKIYYSWCHIKPNIECVINKDVIIKSFNEYDWNILKYNTYIDKKTNNSWNDYFNCFSELILEKN